jgi:hypothetical protein
MDKSPTDDPELAEALVPLLRGVVYAETHRSAWRALTELTSQVSDHLAALGVEVVVDLAEGYAYLRLIDSEEAAGIPKLISRRPLSFRVSLLLALLRRSLMELDTQGEHTRLILTRTELVELVRTLHPAREDDVRLTDQVEADMRKIVDLGFARQMPGQPHTYEVRRILKAFVDAQWLANFDERLADYAAIGSENK